MGKYVQNDATNMNVDMAIPRKTDCNSPKANANMTISGTTHHSNFCSVLEQLFIHQLDNISIDDKTNNDENAVLGINWTRAKSVK